MESTTTDEVSDESDITEEISDDSDRDITNEYSSVEHIPKPKDILGATPNAKGRLSSDSYSYLSPQELKIVSYTSSILEEFILILTVQVFYTYTDRI